MTGTLEQSRLLDGQNLATAPNQPNETDPAHNSVVADPPQFAAEPLYGIHLLRERARAKTLPAELKPFGPAFREAHQAIKQRSKTSGWMDWEAVVQWALSFLCWEDARPQSRLPQATERRAECLAKLAIAIETARAKDAAKEEEQG